MERTELGGRVHLQLLTTSSDSAPASEFRIRRARIWTAVRVNDWIDGAALIDFAGTGASARYAFLRMTFDPALRVAFGQFKRAFDLFELTSSSQILVVERDGRVPGVESCAGIGGICTYSAFTERLQHSSLDIGVLADGLLAGGRFEYMLSLTNGPGGNRFEENGAKSAAARLVWHPTPLVALGANLGVHDYPNAVTGEDAYAPAAALDVELGSFAGGPHLQAGFLTGENWRSLGAAGDPSRFRAAQVIGSWRLSLSDAGRIRAVEPVGRVSWGTDDGPADDAGVLLTPGAIVHFEGRNKVAANLDVWRGASARTEWSLKVQTYLHF